MNGPIYLIKPVRLLCLYMGNLQRLLFKKRRLIFAFKTTKWKIYRFLLKNGSFLNSLDLIDITTEHQREPDKSKSHCSQNSPSMYRLAGLIVRNNSSLVSRHLLCTCAPHNLWCELSSCIIITTVLWVVHLVPLPRVTSLYHRQSDYLGIYLHSIVIPWLQILGNNIFLTRTGISSNFLY